MTHSQIRKLYKFIFEELFTTELSHQRPPLVLHHRPDQCYGLFYAWPDEDDKRAYHEQIEVFPIMHVDDEEIADTLVHELIHAVQKIKGRKINHGKWFKKKMNKKMRKLKKAFK